MDEHFMTDCEMLFAYNFTNDIADYLHVSNMITKNLEESKDEWVEWVEANPEEDE